METIRILKTQLEETNKEKRELIELLKNEQVLRLQNTQQPILEAKQPKSGFFDRLFGRKSKD